MNIDFEDLELPLAELAASGAEAPRPEVRDRILRALHATEAVPAGFVFSMAESDRWLPHPVPGIRMRVLAMNRERGYATLLLDVKPGTRFPAHHHTGGAEECYVISGSIYSYGRRLGPGDFLHADGETDHTELWTDEGAMVLLVVPPEDYMTA